jgi:hypothetical protein
MRRLYVATLQTSPVSSCVTVGATMTKASAIEAYEASELIASFCVLRVRCGMEM